MKHEIYFYDLCILYRFVLVTSKTGSLILVKIMHITASQKSLGVQKLAWDNLLRYLCTVSHDSRVTSRMLLTLPGGHLATDTSLGETKKLKI